VERHRIERNGAEAVLANEPNRVPRVARARVDDELPLDRPELGEDLEQPVAAPPDENVRTWTE